MAPTPHAVGVLPSPPHLATNEHEGVVTEFEQALICAAEAFYRWGGVVLGAEGREANLTGEDCVILQQLVAANRPRRISDLARFANRDDRTNIQYSLKKLTRAGLVAKARAAAHRDTAYEVTAEGRRITDRFLEMRKELLMKPAGAMLHTHDQLKEATHALALMTGLYEHAARLVAGRI